MKHCNDLPESIGFINLPGIDTAAGLERMGHHRSGYLRFLHSFCQVLSDYSAGLQTAYRTKDYPQLRFHAHNLYGVSVMVGANQVASSCAVLLETSTHTDYKTIGSLLEHLLANINVIQEGSVNLEYHSSLTK